MDAATLQRLKQQPADVPCGTCHACCKKDRIRLDPAKDDLSKYRWHMEPVGPVLDVKPNGECTYLTARGCSIHGDAPDICRRFDCRVLFLITPKEIRRRRAQENPTMASVYEAGKRRLDTLKA